MYPYNNVLYARRICPSLGIPVPPRSRFCRFTRRRIARYDHYCPWVLARVDLRTERLLLCALATNVAYDSVNQIAFLRWGNDARQEPGLVMTTVTLAVTAATMGFVCIGSNRQNLSFHLDSLFGFIPIGT
jgi:hypothetical protein